MSIFIYAKTTEKPEIFDTALSVLDCTGGRILIYREHRKEFSRLLELEKSCRYGDVVLTSQLSSLGLTDKDICRQLGWFSDRSIHLAVCNLPPTYEYGISQPLNQAVIESLRIILENGTYPAGISSSERAHSGRKKTACPDNWEILYEKWENHEISSRDFMNASGLKKATFYKLLSEYRETLECTKQWEMRYNHNE